jgi:hypothetical protein
MAIEPRALPWAIECRPFGAAEGGHIVISVFGLQAARFLPPRLVAELHDQFAESAKLDQAIKANLKGMGYGG